MKTVFSNTPPATALDAMAGHVFALLRPHMREEFEAALAAFRAEMAGLCAESTKPQYVPVDKVAAELNLSKKTVFRMINDGRLKAVKIAGRTRVSRASLDLLLEASQ